MKVLKQEDKVLEQQGRVRATVRHAITASVEYAHNIFTMHCMILMCDCLA